MSKAKKNIQKVNVVNFPNKDKWDKLQIVATIFSLVIAIIALILAVISTSLYIREIKKSPDLYVYVSSPERILGKTFFEFGDDKLSNPLDFYVFLNNKGDKKSESLTRFNLIFDKKVIASTSQSIWRRQKESDGKIFIYLKDDLAVNPNTSRSLGTFQLRIPKQTRPLLFALFIIEGDFDRKTGLIYYDYSNNKYDVVHYNDPTKATEIWNKRSARSANAAGSGN